MRIASAVRDYIRMFPDEYRIVLMQIEQIRGGLKDDMAALPETQSIKRHLFEIPEKLSVMIGKKLDAVEVAQFKDKENCRWFAKEFPQFAITKLV